MLCILRGSFPGVAVMIFRKWKVACVKVSTEIKTMGLSDFVYILCAFYNERIKRDVFN